jgi:hypothetical protein
MAKTFFTFGLYVPRWARADYEHVRGAGRIESDVFDPAGWKSHYYNPAFANCLPDDAFWAAKQVMTFTAPEIRALVGTAQYTDAEASEYLVRVLTARQRKIGQWAFSTVLPLDNLHIRNRRLEFEDLAVKYGLAPARSYSVSWAAFDNELERTSPIDGAAGFDVPVSQSRYLVATVHGGDPALRMQVYIRDGNQVVGIERRWREMPKTGTAPAGHRARLR